MSEEEINEDGARDEAMVEAGSKGSVAAGAGQVLLFHLLQVPFAMMSSGLTLAVMCITQAAYVIPAFVIARRKGHQETAKGIIIAASVTALLNVACTGYVFYSFRIS